MKWTDATGPQQRRTTEPGAVVADLMRSGPEPKDLEIVRPSLEDVYLELVSAYERKTDELEPVK